MSHSAINVDLSGFQYDRCVCIVNVSGTIDTGRELPQLVRLKTELIHGRLTIGTEPDGMDRFIAMATGAGAVSLDYCNGHVCRYCQLTMYRLLSFAPLSDTVVGKIVALDERLKRYSYGPPVDSPLQLSALADYGILDIGLVNDPNIELEEGGWKFEHEGQTAVADIMINSVVDSPQLLKVERPIIKGILSNDAVAPVHNRWGARTEENALMVDNDSSTLIAVARIGKLAKGTLIRVDAIAKCFGTRSVKCARGVIDRKSERYITKV